MKLNKFVPKSWRLRYQLFRRWYRDHANRLSFAKSVDILPTFAYKMTFRQNILHVDTNIGKKENMRLAGEKISKIVINPMQTFSFGHVVGNPTAARGFYKSRNLVNGILQEDYGGGLCQVSGILYLAALTIGLKIVERHAHSVDIYEENERFTPLGSDATVVYGYKDIRFQNTTSSPIAFIVFVENGQLVCEIQSHLSIKKHILTFKRDDFPQQRNVITKRQSAEGGVVEDLGVSVYKLLS